jgi:Putative prokaryotic signal transducing protein
MSERKDAGKPRSLIASLGREAAIILGGALLLILGTVAFIAFQVLVEYSRPWTPVPNRWIRFWNAPATNSVDRPMTDKPETPFVEIYRAENGVAANLLKGALEAAGIQTRITDESFSALAGGNPIWWESPRILVPAADVAKAAAIIRELKTSSD